MFLEGFERMVQVNKTTTITVDASMAGTGKVTCRIKSQSGTELDIDIIENQDGTFNIVFTPNVEGDYTINIEFGGEPIPDGNYVIQVSCVTLTFCMLYIVLSLLFAVWLHVYWKMYYTYTKISYSTFVGGQAIFSVRYPNNAIHRNDRK